MCIICVYLSFELGFSLRKFRLLFINTWLLTTLLLCFSAQAINAVIPCTMQSAMGIAIKGTINDTIQDVSENPIMKTMDIPPCHQTPDNNSAFQNNEQNNKQCDNCQCCPVLSSSNFLFSLNIEHNLIEAPANLLINSLRLPANANNLYRPPITR